MCCDGDRCEFLDDHVRVDMSTHVPDPENGHGYNSLIRPGDKVVPGFCACVRTAHHFRVGDVRMITGTEVRFFAVPDSITSTDVDEYGLVSASHPALANLNKTTPNGTWRQVVSAKIMVSNIANAYGEACDATMLQFLTDSP